MANLLTRRILVASPFALAGLAAWRTLAPKASDATLPVVTDAKEVAVVQFNDAGEEVGIARLVRIQHSDSEWWGLLTPQQFYVTRQGQTDPAYSGTLFKSHQPGLFRCICCKNALFRSEVKYDSGTGWPSFWAPIAPQNVRRIEVAGVAMASGVEVRCALCDAHLGHIFDDGPAPTHLRYCINESALQIV